MSFFGGVGGFGRLGAALKVGLALVMAFTFDATTSWTFDGEAAPTFDKDA